MADINGSVTQNPSKYRYWIDWVEDQVNIAANTSRVTATVYVQKISDYSAEGSSNNHNLWIDGQNFNANPYIDMNPETTPRVLVSGQKTITHNADGSKQISISSSGNIINGISWGPSTGSAGATVNLTTIPRAAYITNSNIDFTIGNSIGINLYNPGSLYVRALTYVNGSLIKTQNLGQVSSATLTFNSGEIDAMYAQVPNATSVGATVRIRTYSDAGYSTQVGSDQDKACTASVNQTTNKPTFSTYSLVNVDKNVAVVDDYGETVITSSTQTLLGASTKMIAGYSKVKATVAVADKMVALNSATAVKYRFTNALQAIEAAYSASLDVELELDNVLTNSFAVAAYDSRNLNTAVAGSLSLIAEYSPLSLFSMILARDNGVDPVTTLTFSGQFWKKYFGSNHPSTATGVLNTIVAHYRFKNSLNDWSTQNGTVTVTIAAPGRFTKTAHGFSTGDVVHLTTTGALPTGLTAGTKYFVIVDDADHFWLATSSANAEAGTKITTTGSQSGVHTLKAGIPWTSITPSSDTDGAISFSDAIDGDLGSTGFDSDKSFDIQVRVYDKLSVEIIEETLNVGTPLIHKTKQGMAIKDRYNYTKGGSFQVDGQKFTPDSVLHNMRRQAVMNGNFNVWQRGTSKANPANSSLLADRWMIGYSNSGTLPTTITHSRQLLSSGELQGSHYHYRIAPNGAGSGFGANDNYNFIHKIEHGVRFLAGAGKQITVSVYARSSIANKKLGCYLFQVYGSGGSPSSTEVINGEYVTLTSGLTRYDFTFTLNTLSGKTFGTNNNDCIWVIFPIMWGSTYASRVGDNTGETFVGSGNIDFAQVLVNEGDYAMEFMPIPFDVELERCKRFFRTSYPYGQAVPTNQPNGYARHLVPTSTLGTIANQQNYGQIKFDPPMRALPTCTVYSWNESTTNAVSDANGTIKAANSGTPSLVMDKAFTVYNNSGGSISCINSEVLFGWAADAELP